MIVIQLQEVGMSDPVPTLPDGSKILAFVDNKSGIQVVIPLSEEAAKKLGSQLISSLQVVQQMPDKINT